MRKKKNQVSFIEENNDDEPDAASSSSEQSEEDEDKEEPKPTQGKNKAKLSSSITDYEKQRQRRIEENKAKLQALGVPALASSLPQPKNKKQKKPASRKAKRKQDDNDYQPSEEEEEDEEQSDSSADEEAQPKLPTPRKTTPAKRRPPARPKGKKMKSLNSLTVDTLSKEHGSLLIDHEADNNIASQQIELDEDAALQQALALSIGVSMEDATCIAEASRQDSELGKSKAKIDNSGLGGKRKVIAEADKISHGKRQRKKTKNINTIQLTEDEVIAYFFYFDEVGKGKITVRDLERVALAHDFVWSKQELSEMINAFDKDQDGQLSLDDFQAIAARCSIVGGT